MTRTNLGVFRSSGNATEAAPSAPPVDKSQRVDVSLRLTLDQWRRVKELAIADRSSIQALALLGISRLLEERGLPPL